jgi:adenylate cyclase
MNNDISNERRLDLRIGINLGEIIADEDGQVWGTGVNVAARLQALAQPGSITISGRAKQQVDPAMGAAFISLGEQRVKNIPTPINVFGVVADGARSALTSNRRREKRFPAPAALVVAGFVVLVAGVGLWLQQHPEIAPSAREPAVTVVPEVTRIAVLPFRNASGNPQHDYFAQAITEDLASALGRFSEFAVVASEALASLGDVRASPKAIRRELGVSYLLTGSVRRDGEIVRLVVKLIDTDSGLQLWSERYNRPMGELFEVQDEIIRTVAGEAAVTLGRIESDRVFGKAIPDLEAYDLYIRGRALIARDSRDENVQARELFRRAIEEDPGFALAYVGLAWTYYREASRGWSQFMSRNLAESERVARHALQLEPDLAEAYELLGWIMLGRGEYEQSEVALQKAISLNPNSLGTMQALGNTLTFLGDAEGAIRAMEKSVSLGARPSKRSLPILGLAYVLNGDPKGAIRFLKTYARDRRDHFYYAALAVAHAELGNDLKASEAAEQTIRAWPYFNVDEFVHQFRDPRHRRRIAQDLRKAGLE